MSNVLPAAFLERLKKIIPARNFDTVLAAFDSDGVMSVRINTLKASRPEVLQQLTDLKISFQEIPWYSDALILQGMSANDYSQLDVVKQGGLYRQGLSSLLPVLILNPQKGERVLDFCAAPGSKTTQIAAQMKQEGELIAVEAIRPRFYKLKSVCALLGADNVSFKLTDARRFRSEDVFDKVLVDAPCSSEGRFKTADPKSVGYWSPRKIKEMAHKQKGLLWSASRFLKPGGVLVYSTCTFAPEENEAVVDWVLRKAQGHLVLQPAAVEGVAGYPALSHWEHKVFSAPVENLLRVLPNGLMEGFFVAKFIKQ
ncbi:MAG: RsmB/NOP family class I SAM-dependent RNA methyltransferase [Candidatus Omnitrophica bacterium]|nr:RsmB/NOP family class I SAM-dependent RNA methyltransferase [Candidatus Omnitrophota bacterium]